MNRDTGAVTREGRRTGSDLAWARIAVAIVGVVLLVIGARAAWRSDSATAPLVLGALLIVVALVFSRDLEELSWRWRDILFTVKQHPPPGVIALGEIASQLTEIAGQEAADDDEESVRLRVRLAELAAKAKEAEGEAYAAWQPDRRFTSWATYLASKIQDGQVVSSDLDWIDYLLTRSSPSQDEATRIREGEPRFSIHFRWWGDWLIALRVTSPDGAVSTGVLYGSQYMSGNNFNADYPGEAIPGPALRPGEYVFEWCRALRATLDRGYQPAYVLRRDRVTITPEVFETTAYSARIEPARDEVPSEWDQKTAHLRTSDEFDALDRIE